VYDWTSQQMTMWMSHQQHATESLVGRSLLQTRCGATASTVGCCCRCPTEQPIFASACYCCYYCYCSSMALVLSLLSLLSRSWIQSFVTWWLATESLL